MIRTSQNTPLRFVVIGVGAIGRTHCLAISESHATHLVGVVDVCLDTAKAIAEVSDCKAYSDVAKMLSETKPDVAIICTPPSTHPELACQLMEQGVHVLCEKPIAIDIASAQKMFATAKRNDVLLTMASKFRYVEDVTEAKSIIASGLLGDIVLLENVFTANVDMSHRWNSNPSISGGGVMIDNGTHSVDIIRYLLGPLESVHVIEAKRVHDMPVEETVRMNIKTTCNVLATVELSWSIQKPIPSYISVYGSAGMLEVGWKGSRYRRNKDNDWTNFGLGYDKMRAFQSQIENFAKAVHGQEALLLQPEDALASVSAIEAAYAAMQQNNWQPVAIPKKVESNEVTM